MKKILPIIIASALFFTGCGSAGTGYSSQSYDGAAAMSYTNGFTAETEDMAYPEPAAEFADETGASSEKRYDDKFVYTCHMNIETLNYENTVKSIKEKIKEAGGFVSYEDEYDNERGWYYSDYVDTHNRNINIEARIPSEKYDVFTASLEGDGKIISRSSSVENISREYYDTEAVIESLNIQEERLLSMMDDAQTIDEMIAVESRLTEVQMELNQYKTRLSVMQSDVDYSTVNINIQEVYEYSKDIHTDTFFDRLKNSVSDACDDFGDILENLLFSCIYLIPRIVVYVPVIAVVVIVIKKIIKLKNKKTGFHFKKKSDEINKESDEN